MSDSTLLADGFLVLQYWRLGLQEQWMLMVGSLRDLSTLTAIQRPGNCILAHSTQELSAEIREFLPKFEEERADTCIYPLY